jgi:hypothetical protein
MQDTKQYSVTILIFMFLRLASTQVYQTKNFLTMDSRPRRSIATREKIQ